MDLGIKGKIAFIAAASKGLGRAVAEELAHEGASPRPTSRGSNFQSFRLAVRPRW